MKQYFVIISLFLSFLHTIKGQEEQLALNYFAGGQLSLFTQNNSYPISGFPFISSPSGVYSRGGSEYKTFSFRAVPSFGKQLKDNLLVGIQLGYGYENTKSESIRLIGFPTQVLDTVDFKTVERQYHLGFFCRYILNPQNKLGFFLQPHFGFSHTNERQQFDAEIYEITKNNFIETGADLGFQYNINSRFRIVFTTGGLYFVAGKWKEEKSGESNSYNSFGADFRLSSFGLGGEVRF